jgi:uncharacterized tellurite resistance protein B-like protein
MKETLTRLLEVLGKDKPAATADRDHALHLATAALLFEVVRADGEVRDEERRVMRAAVQSAFGMPADELDPLMSAAESASLQAASVFEFTERVDRELDAAAKKRVVELLWLVAFADDTKHALEEHMIRKIAGLLHVPHPEFIDAKIRARSGQV